MKKAILLLIIILGSFNLSAEVNLFGWRSFTSQMNVSDFTIGPGKQIYFATDGGLSIYNLESGKFQLINSLNGIWDNDLTAIYYDKSKDRIITGSGSGSIVFVDKNLSTEIMLEIQKSNFDRKRINSFSVYSNQLFISTTFGMVIYDLDKEIFTETVLKFGSFTTNISGNNSLIYGNTIYLATDEGIAFAELNSQYSSPKVWKNLSVEYMLTLMKFKDIIELDGKIYASSDYSIYQVEKDTLIKILDDENIAGLTKYSGKVYYSTKWELKDLSKTPFPLENPYQLNKVKFIELDLPKNIFDSDSPFIVYSSFGLEYRKSGKSERIMPNSPLSNYFKKVNTGINGQLLAATDRITSRGCMFLEGDDWLNFYPERTPEILTNGVVTAMQAKDGKYYVGTWGEGAISIDLSEKSPKFTQYSNTNTPMSPFSNNFTIIGEIVQAKDETLWMVNYGETTEGNILIAMNKNGSFYGFQNCIKPYGRYYFSLAIDGSNTKWVGSSLSDGLYYFNENGTLDNPNDDICGLILSSSYPNLPNNQQNSVAIDKNDVLWIGTPSGLASIYNPSAVVFNQKPIVRTVKAVGQQNINDIYVDAVNNKWLATNEGVWILNPDGSEVDTILNKTNSPLPIDIINSITGDENTGTIYIATDLGLYAVSTLYVKPGTEYNIECYPQPFVISKDESLIIDGLAVNSEIFITSITGELIRRISTFSKRVLWDGKDEFGRDVQSGIYLINAKSRTGEQSSVQKVAVIGK